MIHYNPDKHRETIVNNLKRCIEQNVGLNRPIESTLQKRKHPYSSCIVVDGHTYIIKNDELGKLSHEACNRFKEEAKERAAKELGVPVESVEDIVDYAFLVKCLSNGDIFPYVAVQGTPCYRKYKTEVSNNLLVL